MSDYDEIMLDDIRSNKNIQDNYEVWDEERKEWIDYDNSCYARESKTTYPDVNTADKAITSISLKSSKTDTYYLLGLKDYDKIITIS